MIQEPQTPTETVPAETTPPTPLRGKKRKPPRPRPDHCLNCGTPGGGNFCANCGQENKDHTVALKPLMADLLAEFASWDSRLFRTLAALVARPGFLTNEYNAGRRVAYLSPFKLYLTASVLFFLVLPWKAHTDKIVVLNPKPGSAHAALVIGGDTTPVPSTVAEYEAQMKKLPPGRRDSVLEQAITRGAIRANQSPAGFAQTLLGDVSKMMFFLLPLFAVSLKLLYRRTKRLYVEHLVFLLHVHAFAFLLLTVLLLAHPDWLVVCVLLALFVYVVAAMRVVYKQSWGKTLGKFFLLNVGYVVLLSLCLTGTALAALLLP